MKNKLKYILIPILLVMSGCQTYITSKEEQKIPMIVPAIEVKRNTDHSLGIIGEVEPVYLSPMKSAFPARIDTGARTTSVGVNNIKQFERDGQKWISFQITNRESGETHKFEKIIEKKTSIKRAGQGECGTEERFVVIMEIKIGNETIKDKVTLSNRDNLEYQVLIGRNIITGRAIVDTAIKNTLNP